MDATQAGSHTEKLEFVREILERGIAMIHLDPRRLGVVVPEEFTGQPVLRLNFAYGFQIPGFVVDEEGIGGWLRFGVQRSWCFVPWDAVFAITAPEEHNEGRVWWHAAPVEFLIEVLGNMAPQDPAPAQEAPPQPEAPAPRTASPLRVIQGGANDQPAPSNRSAPRQRPALRLIPTRK